jgi:hypothetical protein
MGLIDNLHRITSQSEFSPYQSNLSLLWKWFDPRFQWRFLRSPLVRRSFSDPDGFQQELPFSTQVFHTLQTFSPAQLEALHQCNQINIRRLSKRILMNKLNSIFAAATGISSVLSGLKAFGILLPDQFPTFMWEQLSGFAWVAAISFVLNSVLGYLLIVPKLNLLRAFDDLLSVARAYAGTLTKPSREGPPNKDAR